MEKEEVKRAGLMKEKEEVKRAGLMKEKEEVKRAGLEKLLTVVDEIVDEKERELKDRVRIRQTLMVMEAAMEAAIKELAALSTDQGGAAMIEKLESAKAGLATELEKRDPKLAGMDRMPCRRHLREGPVEDPIKASALHGIKALLREDSAACYICIARAAALNRIKAAGGDSVKAAKDSEARVHSEVCVIGPKVSTTAEAEFKVRPKTMKVQSTYLKHLLTAAPLTPLHPLPDDFFEEEENPDHHREVMLSFALSTLSKIDETDNILRQFLEKGYAMMELHQ